MPWAGGAFLLRRHNCNLPAAMINRLRILEIFRAGGVYALRGYSETIGGLCLRTFLKLEFSNQVYRVDLVDLAPNKIILVIDEADYINAVDRFEEIRLQISIADSLFGWW